MLVALTCNEIVRLLYELFRIERGREQVLGWSVFRRVHQAPARHCHYRRRASLES